MNHVDPETLAAWADGTLSSDEATAVESHLADCPQCRAVSAAFARTLEPAAVAPAAAPAPSPTSQMKWVLPFAATIVITAGVAWKLWPRAEEPVLQVAVDTATSSPSAPPAAQFTPPVTPPPAAPISPNKDAQAAKSAPTRAQKPKIEAPPQPQPVAAPPPPPVLMTPPLPVSQAQAASAAARPLAISVSGAESVAADRWKVIDFVSPSARVANVGATGGRGGGGGSARASIAAIAGQVRWRATGPSTIERSTNEGLSWTPVEIEAFGVVLTAGSAPTPDVCWLVGRSGVVLLSKGGGPFKRVAIPESVDLVSVIAESNLKATVIVADGRAFVTEDEGKTWRARF